MPRVLRWRELLPPCHQKARTLKASSHLAPIAIDNLFARSRAGCDDVDLLEITQFSFMVACHARTLHRLPSSSGGGACAQGPSAWFTGSRIISPDHALCQKGVARRRSVSIGSSGYRGA